MNHQDKKFSTLSSECKATLALMFLSWTVSAVWIGGTFLAGPYVHLIAFGLFFIWIGPALPIIYPLLLRGLIMKRATKPSIAVSGIAFVEAVILLCLFGQYSAAPGMVIPLF